LTDDRATSPTEQETALSAKLRRSEHLLALEIIKVLARHPHGLRRWSVMRAIRENRHRASQDIPQKLEADVERAFRRFCAGTDANKGSDYSALFFKPEEKAGEVWAVDPDRVRAWLERGPADDDKKNTSQRPFRSVA
jgi:hypothetical protein